MNEKSDENIILTVLNLTGLFLLKKADIYIRKKNNLGFKKIYFVNIFLYKNNTKTKKPFERKIFRRVLFI